MKRMQNNFLDILDGLMKMVEFTNQELLRVIYKVNTSEDEERRAIIEYNTELIKVYEHLKTMKKLEV